MATKFYHVWSNMNRRCDNPKNPLFKHYGERGIKVCEDWKIYENFENDMYDEYGYYLENNPNLQRNTLFTLDRIDNNGDYCKENCRWVSLKIQANNRRKRKILVTPEQTKEKGRIRSYKYFLRNREKIRLYSHNYYHSVTKLAQ